MSAVVVDASAGAEIVADTRRGRALARLVPPTAEGWVPEHFYAEVLAVLRRQFLIERVLTETQRRLPSGGSAPGICTTPRSHRSSMTPGDTDTT